MHIIYFVLEDLESDLQKMISSINEDTILFSRLRQPNTIPSPHLKKTQGTFNMLYLNNLKKRAKSLEIGEQTKLN